MSDCRIVRTTLDFFAQLDSQLGDERGSRGEPSSAGFLGNEMVAIVEEFSTGWDNLPPVIAGHGDYRILIKDGYLVRAYAVTGQLASDGAVELVRIRVNLTLPEQE